MRLQSATKRLLAVLAICLAASLPYVSSADNYFVNDDFGVVSAPLAEATALLPQMVRHVLDG